MNEQYRFVVTCRERNKQKNGAFRQKEKVTFRWKEVMEAVLRMASPFGEFLLKIFSSQFQRFKVAVSKSSIAG